MTEIISRLENYISQKSDSNLVIAIAAILYLTNQIVIGSIIHPLGTLNALALQTTMCSEKFKAIASGWISSGEIEIYYKHFQFDSYHPLLYGIFLSLLLARAFKISHVNPRFNWIMLTPFVAAFCDVFENMMHLYFLADLNRATPLLVAVSGLATNIKWLLSLSGTALAIVLITFWIIKYFVRKKI